MNKKHVQRFGELQQQLEHIESTRHKKRLEHLNNLEVDMVDSEALSEWKVKTKSLLINSCGVDSEHYKEFIKAEKPGVMDTTYEVLLRIRPIFKAAKEDYEGGYLTSVRSLVQAEVFDSVLEQASELLLSGYHTAAAVIAGVALETALRELCDRNTIKHGMMNTMNDSLAKAGIYNKNQQKRITALAGIRNSAAHGKPDEFNSENVKSMIQEVEQFLAQNMGEQ
ncbi:hypothetical protein AAE485_03340 [Acidithiobacillus ferriphilus]|uniref:hypothetical protein n=1 Tax=Acidithiobacillus ferriphilus TaxID=1689834 RepID=UPI00390C7FAB